MKKFLPIFISFVFFFFLPGIGFAQTPTPNPLSNTTLPAGGGEWMQDPNVTFVGKTAARSGEFLNWAIQNYDWSAVQPGQTNPLLPFWKIVLGIVLAFLLLFVLITAFIVIITRGRSITIKKFIPRFVGIVLLIVLSYSLIQFIYVITDIVQGFFLKNPNPAIQSVTGNITTKNLLNVAFGYQEFIGYRRIDIGSSESAFISLLLIKFTAVTYYVMVGILLLRKIILWFFIIVSPIFPLLLLYYPVRNTGKIWIGEFFRWLLYAPLFAIFLQGLVRVWSSTSGIPLDFHNASAAGDAGKIVYPTAINILLGGPGQNLNINSSVNLPDTFALYVVALLMLWVVIILPFILLQIFLDYLHNFSFADSSVVKQLMHTSNNFLNKVAPTPPPLAPAPLPFKPQGAGLARQIPTETRTSVSQSQFMSNTLTNQKTVEILKQTNLSVPTLRDVARFETSSISNNAVQRSQISSVQQTLGKIANPTRAVIPQDRTKFTVLKEKLVQEQQKGNPVATSILSAAKASSGNNAHMEAGGAGTGKPGALGAAGSGAPGAAGTSPSSPVFPQVNRVQHVSLDDYEAVKKMWTENYQKLEVPTIVGTKDRKAWVKQDQEKIQLAINLLSSGDVQKNRQAMDMVGQILPFLLIGGFSQSEVAAYLKAKLEAGKSVLSDLEQKDQEEESLLPAEHKKEEASKTMTATAEVTPDDKPQSAQGSGIGEQKLTGNVTQSPLSTEPKKEETT